MNSELFDSYTKYPALQLREYGFPEKEVAFLSEHGMPNWCAPNMHLGWIGEPGNLLPKIEIAQRTYTAIGEDRDDNQIMVDLQDFHVWLLSNDAQLIYVSNDVVQLYDSILHFQESINQAVENDRNAFIENNIPSAFFQPFLSWARQTNPAIIKDGSFWGNILQWLHCA